MCWRQHMSRRDFTAHSKCNACLPWGRGSCCPCMHAHNSFVEHYHHSLVILKAFVCLVDVDNIIGTRELSTILLQHDATTCCWILPFWASCSNYSLLNQCQAQSWSQGPVGNSNLRFWRSETALDVDQNSKQTPRDTKSVTQPVKLVSSSSKTVNVANDWEEGHSTCV